MSLVFGGATSDRVDCQSNAGISELTAITWYMWLYPTTITSGRWILGKGTGSEKWLIYPDGTGHVDFRCNRATTDSRKVSSSLPLTVNAWHFLAITHDDAATPESPLDKGTLTSALAEPTYATDTDGSGAYDADTGEDFQIGNNPVSATSAFQGRIALVAFYNRAMSLGELRSHQWRPRVVNGCVGFWRLGVVPPATAQPDWSGHFLPGTVTGATQGPGVPLPPPWLSDEDYTGAFTAAAAGGTDLLLRMMTDGLYVGVN